MTLNSFKKKILAWDEFDKNFYVLENSINTKIEDLLFIEKQKQILLETKNLEERQLKFEEILNTYSTDFLNIKTVQ